MSSKTQTPQEPARASLWRKRATFEVAKSRHHRQVQYKNQIKALALVVTAVIVIGVVVILANWRAAGGAHKVNCQNYPEYCVPLVGGATGSSEIAQAESSASRELLGKGNGADGVVRGFTSDNVPFIGNPAAPVHFRVVTDYSCSHCNSYHREDLHRFIQDEVLKGKAVLESVMTTGTGGSYSVLATQAALCAAEQGAYWEMSDELYRLSRAMGVENAYSASEIKALADDMGLDSHKLADCVTSQRYLSIIESYYTFASDQGVTGTPTLLVRYGNAQEWQRLDHSQRNYNNMKTMVEGANSRTQ